ncbi:unnamed protein product [Rotaria sordida]|uniref:RING-type domain-containing protein n=1 Tax=Rotaria sordida TaxID=392033 RepID=A0A819SL55_9BILA|nr:unnamed protein product [Rotaria sordida]
MASAGLNYTGKGDTVRCSTCDVEISGWTSDMKPFTIHAQRSPNCIFVRSMVPDGKTSAPSTINLPATTSALMDAEQPSKRQKIETPQVVCQLYRLIEIDIVKQIRKRTFTHWPHRTFPSSAQMIEAGFFNCNVGDRVICIYCNLICQQWTPHTDDPCEIHKALSPTCPYVIAMLSRQELSSIRIVNEQLTRDNSIGTANNDTFRSNEIVYTAACHTNYIEIPRRHASFATWPNENLPSVDDLVKAGFFYTGSKTIVTCFYCNGSLQNWGANDKPMIEHARWFPHCAYAKQLCGADLYRKIQESKRARQEIIAREQAACTSASTNSSSNTDVEMSTSSESSVDEENSKKSTVKTDQKQDIKTAKITLPEKGPGTNPSSSNPCVLCLEEEKRLACIPCGHLATCVPCGHSLRSCPICRTEIDAFVRIYI